MICPHCNISYFEDWTDTNALVWDDGLEGQGLKYSPCPNCGKLVVRIVEGKVILDTEEFEHDPDDKPIITNEFTVYPNLNNPQLAEEMPEEYKDEYIEAKSVLEISPKASAAISLLLLQNLLQEELKIQGRNLSKQIDTFLDLQHVPSHLSKSIDAIRNIGNFAAHPKKETNTGAIISVEPGEADWLLEVLLTLFDFLFVQPKRIEKRHNELNEKLRSMGKPEMKG